MSTPYSKRRGLLDSIASKNVTNYRRLTDSRLLLTQLIADCSSIVNDFKAVMDDISKDPNAASDDSLKFQQADLSNLLSETSTIQAQAQKIADAMDAILNI